MKSDLRRRRRRWRRRRKLARWTIRAVPRPVLLRLSLWSLRLTGWGVRLAFRRLVRAAF
ncbi:hypothetical protein [Streptomyces sp. NPDC101132]|uniref:hypothetical protein n=1 Tax=Streptomyces sp. NPDC101132 TaxID=3366110 RepID=UPI00380789BC